MGASSRLGLGVPARPLALLCPHPHQCQQPRPAQSADPRPTLKPLMVLASNYILRHSPPTQRDRWTWSWRAGHPRWQRGGSPSGWLWKEASVRRRPLQTCLEPTRPGFKFILVGAGKGSGGHLGQTPESLSGSLAVCHLPVITTRVPPAEHFPST